MGANLPQLRPTFLPFRPRSSATMLTVIMILTGYWWIGLIMVIWTLLVDISRVGLGVHYFSDILVGTLIGIIMGGLAIYIFSLL